MEFGVTPTSNWWPNSIFIRDTARNHFIRPLVGSTQSIHSMNCGPRTQRASSCRATRGGPDESQIYTQR
eukprot:3867678-Prymnesium_polylepis.1